MLPHGAFEEAELEISLASHTNRKAQNPRHDVPNSGHGFEGIDHQKMQPVQQKKAEKRIGAYQIVRTLGEGSFGKVKLATHRVTNQQVALKIIARKKLISRDMAGRVEREIEYLQLLRHPHIIKLSYVYRFTVIKTQSEIIMVLEYAGDELFDYIVQHGKMKEDEARRFFQQIICAVEYCHRHKIVHRDLKPENLLLDENLNVKIADFGLSNIMTDGNFLKTSCGSPNYAAPEVINGKLYAGPEVDVWSCGVILYVLLVGRLPFDDEHIPSLFAKIAKGNYVVPNYMSSGAAALIKRMLAVNPVHRASIEEIRIDPWFLKNLAPYLATPVEDFLDTGVDPTKKSSVRLTVPNASPAVQEKLHDQVTEKISKTMGYAIKDIQEALAAEKPSAIKDAYLIVRENKLMQAIRKLSSANLSDEKGKMLFQVPSPPGWNDGFRSIDSVSGAKETVNAALPIRPNSLLDVMSPRSISSTATNLSTSTRPYVSKIGILRSSLPSYHQHYMEARKTGENHGKPISGAHAETECLSEQTEAEKAETARRLNPHSRAQINLDKASKRPVGMTPVPQKRVRPTKWQFGIRSRNLPLEATGCIYRALQKLGAEWIVDEEWTSSQQDTQSDRTANNNFEPLQKKSGSSLHRSGSSGNSESAHSLRFNTLNSNNHYHLPADPWVLRVRWRKKEVYPPSTSTQLSAVDSARCTSVQSSETNAEPEYYVVMHLDIQLYEMEPNVYLVDFKCAGYETSDGMLFEEKDITSPFPFLDLASELIIQLAEAEE
ncbi:Sucrose non-fermenting protein kinase 1 [Golovinomyces cichoracearum]|uniref:non-specific serine/threonine protein kinase n=1 Tax=Golovinomyces cichoracearum TaxID=62708 RepID=A0A420IQP5_9PEZI|nr:Sucrose non-fermenting protein kinase 1 [Golovinomyces cichoracearum]